MNAGCMWFDGKLVSTSRAKIPITTHAIHYGTSAFEGIRAYWNGDNLHIFRLDEHLKRFRKSGEYYNMSLKFTDEQLVEAIIKLCRKNNLKKSCYIRPLHFVGSHGINLNITSRTPTHVAIFAFTIKNIFNSSGISACISSWKRLPRSAVPIQAKMGGNYLNSIIATIDAKGRGFDEAILRNQRGYVSEAPGENIFIVQDYTLMTPPISASVLNGITRNTILKIARDAGYSARIRPISLEHLYKADEVFLCGTAAEIVPVTKIEKKRIGSGRLGFMTRDLTARYRKITAGKDGRYRKWLTAVY